MVDKKSQMDSRLDYTVTRPTHSTANRVKATTGLPCKTDLSNGSPADWWKGSKTVFFGIRQSCHLEPFNPQSNSDTGPTEQQ